MSNMSYCRFANTLPDLHDCATAIEACASLSTAEARAHDELVELCAEILSGLGVSIDQDELASALDAQRKRRIEG